MIIPTSEKVDNLIKCMVRDAIFFGYCQAKIEEGKTSIIELAREFCKDHMHDETPENMKQYYYKFREKVMNIRK